MKDPAREYRESAVRGASPIGLIVILYEEIVRSIRRAQRAIRQNDIEQRTQALNHAVQVIGHLQGILDMERGKDVARNLSRFYGVMRAKILEANVESNQEKLEMLAREFSGLVQTWRKVDETLFGERAAGPGAGQRAAAVSGVEFRRQRALAEP
ncbi:MAG TPA: flagellar export chaperone FliS [Verrucomicrobiae bacterium]|nr:flagellar export chaperone FliS [Verrucomicrobiae bacterium]